MSKAPKYDHMKLIGQFAGGHRHLITLGRILAGISAAVTLVPFYLLWKIIAVAI